MDQQSPLWWFELFFTTDVVSRIVNCTNNYVAKISSKARPPSLPQRYAWPPKWTAKWKPMTKEQLYIFLVLLIYIAQHKPGSERELWERNWFHHQVGIHKIMTYTEFAVLKAALHFQDNDENLEREPGEPKYLKKISILMEIIQHVCIENYNPGQNLAFNEITILMTGCTFLKHITKHKPAHESIQFWALRESLGGLQYLWWFELDLNDGVKNKVHSAVISAVKQLEELAGYCIYMDNLFTSVKLLKEIRGLGHSACGTCRVKRGMPKCVEDIKKSAKAKSVLAVQQAAASREIGCMQCARARTCWVWPGGTLAHACS